MESIIFASPMLIVLYGVALLICIFDLIKRASGYVFPILSAAIFIGATVYAFLLKASYEEIGLIVLVFLTLNLSAYLRHKGDKK